MKEDDNKFQQFLLSLLRFACEIYVYFTAKLFPFRPPNIRILNNSRYANLCSEYLYNGLLHLIKGWNIYFGCTKAERIKPKNRISIKEHYLYIKKVALWHFTEANRYFILYDIARKIIREKGGQDIDDLLGRIENMGERVFRQLSTVGFISHILAFPPRVIDDFTTPIKKYNLKHLSDAIEIASNKQYRGFNVFRRIAMIMLKRCLVVTLSITKKAPIKSAF